MTTLARSGGISPRNVMVDADFSAAEAAEVLFRPIRARAIKRVGFLVVDPFDFEALMQVVPYSGLIGVHHSPLGYTGANEGRSLALGVEHRRNRVPTALTYDDNDLALAVLIAGKAAVNAIFPQVDL
jgi:hypothetical protein